MASTRDNTRNFFAGLLSGDVGYQIQGVAIGWHVYGLHHRAFDLGLVGLALFVPTFVFALPSGVFCDRYDRRLIVAGGAILETLGVVAFVVAILSRVEALGFYLAILAFIGTTRAFATPAERALLPSIVAPERFMRVQTTYSSIRQLIVIGGPALGGALVAIGTPVALGVSAVASVVSALFIARLRIEGDRATTPPTLRDALEGVRFLRSAPIVAGAISLDLFAVLFGGATALLPAFADGVFHIGPTGLGLLRSAPAIGAALVAFGLSRKPLERHVGLALLVAVAGFGAATIGFGFSRSLPLSLLLLAFAGGTDMVSVVIRNGLVQLRTPDAMRGRVNAVENVFIGASNELGAFESGTLAGFIGVVPAVVFGGIGTLAIIALWAFAFPTLRRADRIDT